jgi:hypothetical protein
MTEEKIWEAKLTIGIYSGLLGIIGLAAVCITNHETASDAQSAVNGLGAAAIGACGFAWGWLAGVAK